MDDHATLGDGVIYRIAVETAAPVLDAAQSHERRRVEPLARLLRTDFRHFQRKIATSQQDRQIYFFWIDA
jgi:hypothetical protein